MARPICVNDFELFALNNLPPTVRDYYRSGAGDETTLKWNREAFQKYRIRPRFLRDVSNRNMTTTVLGHKVTMPLGVAPSAMQRMAHADGELGNARACAAAGTVFILSTLSTTSMEEVAAATPKSIKWFQLYVYRDRNITLSLVRRAEEAGYKAIVLTIDAPLFGDRRADIRNQFTLPSHLNLANLEGLDENKIDKANGNSGLSEYVNGLFDETLSWKDVLWLRSVSNLPIVLKGVLTAEDAILGVEHGAAGIVVSNHGARQVDGTPATIEVLPEIVKAVGDRVEVYMDGGVTQGTDVFRAIALGARMVFFGRPMLWGLSYDGEKGARAVLEVMRAEIDKVMALTGCATLQDIKKEMVVHESFYSRY